MNKKHKCPVCGEHEFPKVDSYEICPVCGWEDEWFQEKYPDEEGGANTESLNQYREWYKAGNRPDWMDDIEDDDE